MKFSHAIIQEYIDKKLPEPQKLAELLTLRAFEVENLRKVGQDYVYDIDILPNRAHDALSHIGVAREAAVLTGAKLKFKLSPLTAKTGKVDGISVEVKDKNLCPRYTAAVVYNVNVGNSPKWLAIRLAALGVKPINNIVDAVNYAMMVTGQPLHAFDYDKIKGGRILVRMAKNGEIIEALDDKAYILEEDMLVIADTAGPLAIAGIKGGKRAEVSAGTKTLVLESANFDAFSIRHTSEALGLETDAGKRFINEVPIAFAAEGLAFAVQLIKKVAGGKDSGYFIDTLTKLPSQRVAAIRTSYTNTMLGANISQKAISDTLKSLGFYLKKKDKDTLIITIPRWRLDIEREEDLVEEVGRVLGYENIKDAPPVSALVAPKRNVENYWRRRMRDFLANVGFNEIYSPAFVSARMVESWGFDKNNLWEVENPISSELQYLAPSLAPQVSRESLSNLRFFERVRVFEIAEAFARTKAGLEEQCLVITSATKDTDPKYFYELKGTVIQLLNSMGISDIWFDDALTVKEQAELSYLHVSRRAQIKVGDNIYGYIGQIHPRLAGGGTVMLCELSVSKIAREAEGESQYLPVSNFPEAVRDISILVPRVARIGDVMRTIDDAGGALLRDVDLFDYYENPEMKRDEKSIAFHLVFQAQDRTLTSSEVDKLMEKIIKAVEGEPAWTVR